MKLYREAALFIEKPMKVSSKQGVIPSIGVSSMPFQATRNVSAIAMLPNVEMCHLAA